MMHITLPRIRTAMLVIVVLGCAHSANAQSVSWRTDYASARREASEKARPLLLEFSTESCVWCRKLEATTLRDPAVTAALAERFVCLKVDGDRETGLVSALNVTTYPTMVLASADGKILGTMEGYQEPEKLLEQLNRIAPPTPAPEWMVRDFQEAARAIAISDYSRAIILLKGVTKDGGERSIQVKSRTVLSDLESQANTQLSLARQLHGRGRSQEAVDVLTDLMRSYGGTQASVESGTLLASISAKPEVREGLRVRKARELLAQAKDAYRGEQFLSCMERCEILNTSYSDLAESTEAKQLVGSIHDNPEYLAKACEALNHRTGAMYLALAESWLKKGEKEQAIICLERVVQTAPGSRQADAAKERLTSLQKSESSTSLFRPVQKP
ncbi:MAG: thioredoxin family protein [Gemmataceae bacterium]